MIEIISSIVVGIIFGLSIWALFLYFIDTFFELSASCKKCGKSLELEHIWNLYNVKCKHEGTRFEENKDANK